MNLKHCNYMKSEEFKARQVWLKFTDTIGIAFEAINNSVEKINDWFKSWCKEFRTEREIKKQTQLKINFLNWLELEKTHAG